MELKKKKEEEENLNNTKTTRKGTGVGKLHNYTILRKLNQKDHIT